MLSLKENKAIGVPPSLELFCHAKNSQNQGVGRKKRATQVLPKSELRPSSYEMRFESLRSKRGKTPGRSAPKVREVSPGIEKRKPRAGKPPA
jgi:hypothetical protein